MTEFLTKLAAVNDSINGFVWVKIGLVLLIGAGVIMSITTGFFQVTHISHWWKKTAGGVFKKESHNKNEHGSVSQFQSLCTALAATIGTGNIAGVSAAIVVGGPGAVFWMWVAAFFGMMTNFSENVLGIYFRRRNETGEWSGGAMYYLHDGLGSKKGMGVVGKVLAVLFSVFAVLASFGIGNLGQINKIVLNIKSAFFPEFDEAAHMIGGKVSILPLAIGVILMIIGAIIIIGGLKRIAAVAEKVVPFMAVIYIVGALIIVFLNIAQIGTIIGAIFKFALGTRAVAGGITGEAIKLAITQGCKRGVFSNEAGLGSSVMVHSNSDVKEPVMQGLWGIFEVFADTFIVCTMTAVVVLSSGFIDLATGLPVDAVDDATLVAKAFGNVFGRPGEMFVAIAILLFAFTTVLGWSHYGSKAVEYLAGLKAAKVYRVFFVLLMVAGALMTSSLAWDISDTFNGLMMIPNLIGVLALAPLVRKITKNYIARRIKKEDVEPMLSFDENIQNENMFAVIEEQSMEDNSDSGMGFTAKLTLLCIAPLVLITIIITSISVKTLTENIESERERSLQLVAANIAETYTILYEGDYKVSKSGSVSKGDKSISGDTELIDALKAQTGYDISMLFGNMRLITTLTKENGARINGSSIKNDFYTHIQTGEPLFLKNEMVISTSSYVYYLPLINSDGSVVGAIEVVISSEDVQDTINTQTRIILLVGFVLMAISIVILIVITRSMSSTMKEIKRFLGELKDGNLATTVVDKHLKRTDELGDIYLSSVKLQSTLYSIVNGIKQASDKITESASFFTSLADNTGKAADEVSASTSDISMKAKAQSDGAQVVNDNVISMNTEIARISDDMDTLVEYSDSMAKAEDKSKVIMDELNEESVRTKRALDAVSKQIKTMSESIEGIKQAITLISDIAEETDLLSLNASIEAAKAGDAGRGFAVVAEQIGKLALQSNNSAEEINGIIRAVIADTLKTAEIMKEVTMYMEQQQKKLEETKLQSETVSDGVEKSLSGIENIKVKVESLSESSVGIKNSVSNLAETSVETDGAASSTIQVVATMMDNMNNLKESAGQLEQLASQLRITLSVFHE